MTALPARLRCLLERGSITASSDSAGNLTGAIDAYDEYGIPQSTNSGRFQYTGQAWLTSLGLYYYKARFYSPTLGRFLQTDPIGYGDGMNVYNYVGSDPVNRSDPSGLRGAYNEGDIDVTAHIYRYDPGNYFSGPFDPGSIGNIHIPDFQNITLPPPADNDIVVNGKKRSQPSRNSQPIQIGPFGYQPSSTLYFGGVMQNNQGCAHKNSTAATVAKWADSISTGAGVVAGVSAGLGLATAPTGAGFVGFEAVAAGAATVSTVAAGVGAVANAIDGNWQGSGWDVAGLVGGSLVGRVAKDAYQSTRAFGDLSASQARGVKFLGYGAGNAVGSAQALVGCQ